MESVERLLRGAAEEIEQLRRQNEILAAKVETMELFATALHAEPSYRSRGMTEDIAWAIRRFLDTSEEEAK